MTWKPSLWNAQTHLWQRNGNSSWMWTIIIVISHASTVVLIHTSSISFFFWLLHTCIVRLPACKHQTNNTLFPYNNFYLVVFQPLVLEPSTKFLILFPDLGWFTAGQGHAKLCFHRCMGNTSYQAQDKILLRGYTMVFLGNPFFPNLFSVEITQVHMANCWRW